MSTLRNIGTVAGDFVLASFAGNALVTGVQGIVRHQFVHYSLGFNIKQFLMQEAGLFISVTPFTAFSLLGACMLTIAQFRGQPEKTLKECRKLAVYAPLLVAGATTVLALTMQGK